MKINFQLPSPVKAVILTAALLFSGVWASAQNLISGSVTDSSGMPVIGAGVVVKATDTGTVSDLDGKYSVPVSDG